MRTHQSVTSTLASRLAKMSNFMGSSTDEEILNVGAREKEKVEKKRESCGKTVDERERKDYEKRIDNKKAKRINYDAKRLEKGKNNTRKEIHPVEKKKET